MVASRAGFGTAASLFLPGDDSLGTHSWARTFLVSLGGVLVLRRVSGKVEGEPGWRAAGLTWVLSGGGCCLPVMPSASRYGYF